MSKKTKIILTVAVFLVAEIFLSRTALGKYVPFSDLSQNIQNKILDLFGLGSSREKGSVQLLLINEITYKEGINNIGDIVGVFDGDHQFSENEQHSFDIVRINGITREQAEARLNNLSVGVGSQETKYQYRIINSDIIVDNLTTKIKRNRE